MSWRSPVVRKSLDPIFRFTCSCSPDEKQLQERLQRVYSQNGLAEQLDQPVQDFQVSSNEALLFSNSDRINESLLKDRNDSLIGKLKALENDQQRIEMAYWTILSRPPNDDETKLLATYLAARQERPLEGMQQLAWILLTSTEFRFNH